MRFQIRRSIRNMYKGVSLDDGKEYDLRIKGKVLWVENTYNPVAVGDIAIGETYSDNEALIESIEERKSSFTRFNLKSEVNQTIASNFDQSVIVTSFDSPPFRPKFLDRAIACSFNAKIVIAANKSDLDKSDDVIKRLELYRSLGFDVIYLSTYTGEGLDQLRERLNGKLSCFVGQSGVGKSSIINKLLNTDLRVGEISEKYNRGKHTTNHSLFIPSDDFSIIDTPGVREIVPPLEDQRRLMESFPELRDLECEYSSCLHSGEDGCLVPSLIEKGVIDQERYESYLRILEFLKEKTPIYLRKKRSGRKDNQGPGSRESSERDKLSFPF